MLNLDVADMADKLDVADEEVGGRENGGVGRGRGVGKLWEPTLISMYIRQTHNSIGYTSISRRNEKRLAIRKINNARNETRMTKRQACGGRGG